MHARSAYLNMSCCMLRADSLLRLKYSDLFIMEHSEYAPTPGLFDYVYFVSVSNESKTNHVILSFNFLDK